VGFLAEVKIGDELKTGDLIGTVFCDKDDRGAQAVTRIQAAYSISDTRPSELPSLIKEVIE
jgi:thymidine phosphorylase